MNTKICSKCNVEKQVNNFCKRKTSKDGLNLWCKDCVKEYAENNKEVLTKYQKDIYQKNRDERLKSQKIYAQEHKEEISEYKKKYKRENALELNEKRAAQVKIRRKNDFHYRMRLNISRAIIKMLKINGSSKDGKSHIKYVPFSYKELEEHFEKLFSHPDNLTPDGKVWMSKNNQGYYDSNTWDDNDPSTWKWSIDHIIPHSDLPYTSMEDDNFKKCWALDNLRPYSAKQNVLDGVKRTRHKK